MHFESIPRGSIAAQLTAADMLARLQDYPNAPIELHQAVTVLGHHLVDSQSRIEQRELIRCSNLVARLYLG